MKSVCFFDTEVSETDLRAHDLGAVKASGEMIHTGSHNDFMSFISDTEYLCGHNIIDHDLKYIDVPEHLKFIDTLYLSPLMFPDRPYHALLKDDKLRTDVLNNPLNDAIKAKELFYDEINAFEALDDDLRSIYYLLLKNEPHFSDFWDFIGYSSEKNVISAITRRFAGLICGSAPLSDIISDMPCELAYCLAMISANEEHSLIPKWVIIKFPKADTVIRLLRNTSCRRCEYCRNNLEPDKYLSKYFGYMGFRTYNGEPLQENAVRSACEHRSLLAIFPTGGGKSLTFQIPALMSGETERALTVVISPLQSLMKDQVDNLEKRGIAEAVTINGLLSPVERAEAIARVESGIASILYISPESLRSVTIEKLFLSRHIDRFVIDEAHCFSAWGQDFRVDYLYIGDFIRELQEKKGGGCRIPVSCFTATAKQKVISDIKEYFKNKLDIELELYATDASRTNLRYEVLYKETDDEKYDTLRTLIESKNCPAIVYVSRTKRTIQISEKLNNDGFRARPFNGKMDSSEKQANQEAFINNDIQIIVATSAFGMGVDKSDVGLVVHFDISDSLENYVQEAGRAGRDQSLQAECYVLFNDGDLDKHFILLNQTKLSISEIQQVWKAIKELTRFRAEVCFSPLEIARQAGWDDSVTDIETRVKTAVQALENAGYIKRGKNYPRVYATGILVKSMIEASRIIEKSTRFKSNEERTAAKRIIGSLISSKSVSSAGNSDAESRVDYLADTLGLEKQAVIHSIQQMREEGLIADSKDLTAYIFKTDTENKSMLVLRKFQALETFLLGYINADKLCMNFKELNEAALAEGIKTSSVNSIKTLFYYWTIRNYIQKEQDQISNRITVVPKISIEKIKEIRMKSYHISGFIVNYLFGISGSGTGERNEVLTSFSILELMKEYQNKFDKEVNENDIEEALLFLSKTGALKLEDGFLVLYSGMRIKRLILDNKIRYKKEDYRQLDEFYKQKIQQIHIVGEYANMMVHDYDEALQFVNDYFLMDYKKFLSRYFAGERAAEIKRNITPGKYGKLFDTLSARQLEIISDDTSKYIVVTAGPGSGKTKVLVHKLASLLLLEDVKHEQLLMLTFSRAAATEFKSRLRELIGNAANFIEIKTFHSYCFDLMGKIGNIIESDNYNMDKIITDATELIRNGDVDHGKITKTVLVIDEAQDINSCEFGLVEALMEHNDDMRVIAVGDDDQNIYSFRGSDSKYMKSFITVHGAAQYSLLRNYRSCTSVVYFANNFAGSISGRMKDENIEAVTDLKGEVKLIKHRTGNIETAVVNDLLSSALSGNTCILTNTNQECLLIMGILKQKNRPAKLIQSIEGFDIYDIAEIRYFLKKIDLQSSAPVIDDEHWKNAVGELQKKYRYSSCLDLIMDILLRFEEANERKYRTDLEMFLHESKLEDFCSDEDGKITVSTMHKAKGREFDNVFMLLNNADISSDEEKRKLYVGMTRAKKLLHIHYCGNSFDIFRQYASANETDMNRYPKPNELILQLTHKDAYLDFFKGKKGIIARLQSGTHLFIHGNNLLLKRGDQFIPVMQYSSKCIESVQNMAYLGYEPYDAAIRFICAWKGKNDTEETAVILADIYFRRKN